MVPCPKPSSASLLDPHLVSLNHATISWPPRFGNLLCLFGEIVKQMFWRGMFQFSRQMWMQCEEQTWWVILHSLGLSKSGNNISWHLLILRRRVLLSLSSVLVIFGEASLPLYSRHRDFNFGLIQWSGKTPSLWGCASRWKSCLNEVGWGWTCLAVTDFSGTWVR